MPIFGLYNTAVPMMSAVISRGCLNFPGRLLPAPHRSPAAPAISIGFQRWRAKQACRASGDEEAAVEEPDWEKEMELFKERMKSPNQLATLRKLAEDDVDTGRVLAASNGLAIIEGLNNDAAIGTTLQFFSGASGTLLWRRDDNLCYALMVAGQDLVSIGEPVACKVGGVIQLVNEEGPTTQREFASLRIPAGPEVAGRVIDFLGREWAPGGAPGAPIESKVAVPLLNAAPPLDSRESICSGITTGVRAVDVIAPLGKGQSLLCVGNASSGKSTLLLDLIVGAARDGVQAVYACVGRPEEEVARAKEHFETAGVMGSVTVVAAPEGRPTAEQYAALCAACSVGEAHRDAGGDSIVVLDDARCMVGLWEDICRTVGQLGEEYAMAEAVRQAEDSGADDVPEPGVEGGEDKAGSLKRAETAERENRERMTEEQLVEYEGTLVTATAAQRRKLFSALLQRAAKMNRKLGGGSMTLIPVLRGTPATGQAKGLKARRAIEQMSTLTDEQKKRMLEALEAKEKAEGVVFDKAATEAIEEFMSITDGQMLIEREGESVSLKPSVSLSRIGTRAYRAKAIRDLAPSVRLELAQVEDEGRFAAASADSVKTAGITDNRGNRARVTRALLRHRKGGLSTMEEEACMLQALRDGLMDGVAEEEAFERWEKAWAAVQAECEAHLGALAESGVMTAQAEAAIRATLKLHLG